MAYRWAATPSTLRIFDIFNDLTDTERTSLLAASEMREYKAGDTLIVQGDYHPNLYYIISGCLTVKRKREEAPNNEIMVFLLKPGDGLGESTIFHDYRYRATISALADSVVLCVDKQVLAKIADNNHKFLKALFAKSTYKFLEFLDGQDKLMGHINDRILALEQMLEQAGVAETLTKAEIARLLGVSRVAVSQAISKTAED